MSGLDAETIKQLLEEDARQPRRGGGGKRVDPTADRSLVVWMKLNHHICGRECPHRTDPNNPTRPDDADDLDFPYNIGNACWNPNCIDPRDKQVDRGSTIVSEVKHRWICRYCYLDSYLLDE